MFAIERSIWKKPTRWVSGGKKPRVALRPLNLAVEEGEVFGFLGPNGAGKTTTLKLLMGLVLPTGDGAHPGQEHQRSGGQGADRLPAGTALFLRLPDRQGTAGILCAASGVEPKERTGKIDAMLERVD